MTREGAGFGGVALWWSDPGWADEAGDNVGNREDPRLRRRATIK